MSTVITKSTIPSNFNQPAAAHRVRVQESVSKDSMATSPAGGASEASFEKSEGASTDSSQRHFITHDHDGFHLNYAARQSHLPHRREIQMRSRRFSDHLREEGVARALFGWMRNNMFLSILVIVAIVTSFFNTPQWSYVDWHIIAIMFELMAVLCAFERYGVLQWFSMKILSRAHNERSLSIAMSLVALGLGMFATNDVTILTIIPLVLMMKKRTSTPMYLQMTLVTICANLGSCLTPFGNPHNLYIYTHFNITLAEFMRWSVPLFLTSLVLIFVTLAFVPKKPIEISKDDIPQLVMKRRIIPFAFLALVVFINLRINDWRADVICAVIALVVTMLFDPRVLFHINWNLIFTLFFIFIGIQNIAHMSFLQTALTALVSSPIATYISALLMSQVITNVPVTVLLANFINHGSAAALFFGADIGGLGTPIASLANLITISLANKQYPEESKPFLRQFLTLNFIALAILGTLFGVLQYVGLV